MSGPIIGGLDLSLTATGIAIIGVGRPKAIEYKPKTRGYQRLADITETVLREVKGCDVIAVEGLAFGAKGSAVFQTGGLWYVVGLELWRAGLTVVTIPPANAKKYATGKGNSDKDQVLAAVIRRFDTDLTGNNAADALVLAAMTADYYGHPVAVMPQAQRDSLRQVQVKGPRKGLPVIDWPELSQADGKVAVWAGSK